MTALLFVTESPPTHEVEARIASTLGLVDADAFRQHVWVRAVSGAVLWSAEEARNAALALMWVHTPRSVVAVGRRVADAFDLPTADHRSRIPAPPVLTQWKHPAGPLITYAPMMTDALHGGPTRRALLPELILGCPTLRPWHFRLDDPAVLLDLAVAVAPSCVAVGIAAMLWARSQHVARQARLASPLLAKVDAATGAEQRPPAWDNGLSLAMYILGQDSGARTLAAHWLANSTLHANAGDKWLLKLAEGHDDLAATADRNVARATTLRYLLAEVSP